MQKIRKFESSGVVCRPAPDVYAVRVTAKTPIVLRGGWNCPVKKGAAMQVIVVGLSPHHGT